MSTASKVFDDMNTMVDGHFPEVASRRERRKSIRNKLTQLVIDTAKLVDPKQLKSSHYDADQIDIACEADFTVVIPLPVTLDDLGSAIEDAADQIANDTLESHLTLYTASNVHGSQIREVAIVGCEGNSLAVTFMLAIDADLKMD